jgi:hypothetical protein
MIIPMVSTPDFLLVHGSTVNLYKDVLTGSPRVLNVVNKKSNWETEPMHPASSKRRPQFTAWCRPERYPGYKGEFIFLIREDGAIRHYQRLRGQMAGTVGNSENFGCHVNTAVTSFILTKHSPDYLIAAGDMSPGEFLSVGVNVVRDSKDEAMTRDTQMGLVKQATLPDWSPIMDMQVMQGARIHGRASIVTTAGRQPFGAINELRIGYEAQISSLVDLSQLDESLVGAHGVWALLDPTHTGHHYICSYPGQTIVVFMSKDEQLETSKLQVDAEQSTIFATITPYGLVIMVSESSITSQRLFEYTDMEVDPGVTRIQPEGRIVAACYHDRYILQAIRTRMNTSKLQLYELHPNLTRLVPTGDALTFADEITAITMFDSLGLTYALVTTSNHELSLYTIITKRNDHEVLREGVRIKLREAIIGSIHVMPNSGGTYVVLCGMRDGLLGSVQLHLEQDNAVEVANASQSPGFVRNARFGTMGLFNMGHGPVQVSPDMTSAQRAFVLCDNEAVVVEVPVSNIGLHFTSIYLTDENDSAFCQSPLAAITSLPTHSGNNFVNDDTAVACYDGQNLIFARLLHGRKPLPRRLPMSKYQTPSEMDVPPKDISGTPTKLLFSSKLDANIVAGVKYEHRPKGKVPEPAWQGRRVTRGFLSIVPVAANKGYSNPHDQTWNKKTTQVDFAPSERILSICEWRFERDGRRYHYLLVGTSIQGGKPETIEGRRQRHKKGRLWFLAPRKSDDGTIRIDLKSIKDVGRPVRVLAVLDETKVVVAPDDMLIIYTFSAENK